MSAHQPGSTPAPTVWHCFRCADARREIDWLVSTLGFVETACYSEGDLVTHAELLWPEGGGVMLGDAGRGADDPHATPTGTGLAYMVTADSEAVYRRAVESGADVVLELRDTDYGDRTFSVRDPEGNVWSVGQYRGEPLP
ncbi:VOC family protein [Dietzia sp. CH92]|uniref:VOC family protein n=1 Tax=Dietzia sp. CH92 TaxID=3051823 RepID=UPI0028D468CC|nr:VOC family protein [Dietzia sp. CH92]